MNLRFFHLIFIIRKKMQEVQIICSMIYGSNKYHITKVINTVIKEAKMDQVKTYRPIHINMESDLLFDLDMYKGKSEKPRALSGLR
ncbi:hypothetical protein C6W91_17805 [Phaeobacter sp. SYSU ZJ3003]